MTQIIVKSDFFVDYITMYRDEELTNVTESRKMVPNHNEIHCISVCIFNCISTYVYVFPEYLLHNFGI